MVASLQNECASEFTMHSSTCSATLQNIRKPQLDESLPGNADSLCFSVDGTEHIDRKINIDSLNLTAWPARV